MRVFCMRAMSKKKLKPNGVNAETLIKEAEKIRKQLESKVYRRKDGVLQCPEAYAEGYGIQDSKINHN